MDNVSNNNKIAGDSIRQLRQEVPTGSINALDIFFLCLGKWPVFLFAVIAATIIAMLYIESTAPTYESEACVLIKQDRRAGRSGMEDFSTSFSTMGNLFSSQTNVNNEILSFKSPAIMANVVEELGLRSNYTTRYHFYNKVLYGATLPYEIIPLEFPETEKFELRISKCEGDSVVLSKITTYLGGNKYVLDNDIVVPFNDTTDTPLGRLVVVPNRHLLSLNPECPVIDMQYLSKGSAISKFQGGLSATLTNKESTAITLTLRDRNSARSRDALNAVIKMYNRAWVEDRNLISVSTAEFIEDRLEIIMRELNKVDGTLTSFKSAHRILDPKISGNMYMNQESKIQDELFQMRNSLAMAEYVLDYINSLKDSGKLFPSNTGIDNQSIETQIAEYNKNLLKRNNFIVNSSPNSPVIKKLDYELSLMRDMLVTSIENHIVTLETQIKALQDESGNNTNKISSNPKQTEKLTDIERQQKVKESLYLFLLQKREENELSKAFTAYNNRVISAPSSGRPVAPDRARILLIAILIGFAIPLGLIYLKESTNTKVRSRSDLDKLSIPFLGEIPLGYRRKYRFYFSRHKNAQDQNAAVVQPKKRDVINEAFRVVRSNIEFVCGEDAKVMEITSFNVGSGKTFISVNLASALAIKGLKICSVDLDIRKGTLSEYVGSPKTGIRDYLSGKINDFQSIIVKDKIVENFDIIPVGALPPNPSELLYSERLDALVAELRKQYDYIFLDCPPAEIVADSFIVNRTADRTLFVVRAELMERDMLPELENYYQQQRFKGLMLILNGTEAASRYGYRKYGSGRYGYGYGYGRGYGYGYSHGNYGHYGYGTSSYGSDKEVK